MTNRLTSLPNSQTLDWSVGASPDGTPSRTARVSQPRLQEALSGQPAAAPGILGGLQAIARRVVPAAQPKQEISQPALDRMKRLESIQHRVSELVPYRPNNVPSIVASDGEAFHRHEMRLTSGNRPAQYSAESARETVRWGTGVCTDVNNALFRVLAADNTSQARAAMRERAAGRSTRWMERYPVIFATNDDPHGFVLVGDPRDPRQASDVLVGDIWEALPIVKSWANTEYRTRPYQVKMQAVAGASAFQDLPLEALSDLARQRVASDEVDAHLRGQNRPIVGPALLRNVYDICRQHGISLFDCVTTAEKPSTHYQSASTGEVFTPSVALHDYQDYRAALSKPAAYASFKIFSQTTS
ncbi:hypothetical protein [Burkholderia sp. SCN-KJ]|uniref:hypothetical protein n=1 Tax=Burkholderia sp. SCN-KJ TaxID=2969248 RepID=UPI00214F6251|nr:hypothetical protein [Burkholderia sp. SCN-KJ]MCR4468304.1 hypothetical protein [Burkholderia sp. SCN-KJ]